jgi:hypothetical protein
MAKKSEYRLDGRTFVGAATYRNLKTGYRFGKGLVTDGCIEVAASHGDAPLPTTEAEVAVLVG